MALPAIGATVGANCLANPLKSILCVCEVVRQFNQGSGIIGTSLNCRFCKTMELIFFKFVNNDFLYAGLGALT